MNLLQSELPISTQVRTKEVKFRHWDDVCYGTLMNINEAKAKLAMDKLARKKKK